MIPVKYSTIPAEWFTQNIDEEVAKSIRAKNQSLKFSTNFETVDVDPRLTQMAFTRALHNATKFGLPDSEIILMIHSDPQHKLVMSLHNKGPQISPQLIEKIMKPFQMDENIMNHSVGMGLGLSICNTLLKAQNASLKVQNVNDGVVVSFHFK
jgi:K+-sensing histidine kinase KdpD